MPDLTSAISESSSLQATVTGIDDTSEAEADVVALYAAIDLATLDDALAELDSVDSTIADVTGDDVDDLRERLDNVVRVMTVELAPALQRLQVSSGAGQGWGTEVRSDGLEPAR